MRKLRNQMQEINVSPAGRFPSDGSLAAEILAAVDSARLIRSFKLRCCWYRPMSLLER